MIFNVSVSPSGALPRAPLGGIACPIPPKTPRAVKGDRRRSRDKYAPVPLNEPPPRAANSLTTEKHRKGIVLAGAEPRVFVGRIKEKRRFTRLSRLCSNGCVTTCLSNGRPYGLGGLSRRDRQRQSVPPLSLDSSRAAQPQESWSPDFRNVWSRRREAGLAESRTLLPRDY